MPTRPARIPFRAIDRSGFLPKIHEQAPATRPPMAAAIEVVVTSVGNLRRMGVEHRTAVEAKPTEPQQEDTNGRHRHVRRQDRTDLAVDVLALTSAEDEDRGKAAPTANRVHQGRTGKVDEAHAVQPAAAPLPATKTG